jgi:hypothetical protein
MKKNHIVIKSVLKRAEKPLDAQGIMLRWFDNHKPRNINKDLEDMVKLGILRKLDKGYYSLVPTPTPTPITQ